ncbi:MAG: hypothetical protein JNL53_17505 [Cyclobacteriaceae bacterium]|nr:hypothetical protein [Cyclobacteriaceae bacterium]
MIKVITLNLFFFKRQEIWFHQNEEINLVDQNLFYQSKNKPLYYPSQEFQTLITLLTEDSSVLWKRISRTFQYHIRKAEKTNSVCWMDFSPNESRINDFIRTHQQFSARKKLQSFSKSRLAALLKSKNICFTGVDVMGKPVLYHCYLVNGNTARLLSSHDDGAIDSTLRGYLNKYLHWKDMLGFKELTYQDYDWGGISHDPEDGRRFFKESFGGSLHLYYNYQVQRNFYKVIKKGLTVFKRQ